MGNRVMVFAPVPVLTVTIEQQADAVELHLHPGGQGVWQARMIALLGVEVTLCASVGGEVGAVLAGLLDTAGITARTVTRTAGSGWYVHDRRGGERRPVADYPGAALVRHDLDELYDLALAEGLRSTVSLLSGPAEASVVAAEVYRRLAADLAANGVRVVADLSGGHLDAAVAGGADVIKVSDEQLADDGRASRDGVGELIAAGQGLRARGAGTVLVSRTDQPSLAILPERVLEVRVPHLEVADPIGAGDSMSAGVAAVLARGGGIEEAIRTGAAAGALNVTRHGLGTGRLDAIQELMGRVSLVPLDQEAGQP
jgi:1-phosphofructokinase